MLQGKSRRAQSPAPAKAGDLRKTYRLTADEAKAFAALAHGEGVRSISHSTYPDEGKAFAFWRKAAAARGLDHRTILGHPIDRESFTALPLGHGKHWCFPLPLKCKTERPQFDVTNVNFRFGT